MTQLSHDPFSRTSIVRDKVELSRGDPTTCAWCGSVRQNKNGDKHLYLYRVVRDDGLAPVKRSGKLFCCIGCWRYYNS